MATIHLHQTTTATPTQFVAGLTDFGPGRKDLFPNSADGYLRVHDQGPDWADVTEGSNGIWERLRYDWSNPGAHHADDYRLQHVGRPLGPHLYPYAPARRDHRRGCRRSPRGQEPEGAADPGPGGGRRQARPGQGAGQHHQGHRDQELPDDSGECLTWLHGAGLRCLPAVVGQVGLLQHRVVGRYRAQRRHPHLLTAAMVATRESAAPPDPWTPGQGAVARGIPGLWGCDPCWAYAD